jgi:hypothetical protein
MSMDEKKLAVREGIDQLRHMWNIPWRFFDQPICAASLTRDEEIGSQDLRSKGPTPHRIRTILPGDIHWTQHR